MMTDMATAYGVFANGGYRIDLHPLLEVTDSKGVVLESYNPPSSPIFGQKVLPDGVSFIISDILADNGARIQEFGGSSELKITGQTVSVKTGTTNDFRDNWTIGYTPHVVVATWVGNNNNTPMGGIASGITGAAPIWHTIMANILEKNPSSPLQKPANVIAKVICSTSGLLPPAGGSCPVRNEYFIQGTEPVLPDPGIQKVWIDKTTQQLPPAGKTDNLDLKDEVIVKDPTGDSYCVTCPQPTPTPTPGH